MGFSHPHGKWQTWCCFIRQEKIEYRLICLLHAWSKVLDKLVTNKLVFHAQSQGFLHKNQFGFTPGKGTEDALNELKNMIRDSHESD